MNIKLLARQVRDNNHKKSETGLDLYLVDQGYGRECVLTCFKEEFIPRYISEKKIQVFSVPSHISNEYLPFHPEVFTPKIINKEFAYGIVQGLNAAGFCGTANINGYLVERISNENGAVWVVFQPISSEEQAFQYNPGGRWELLDWDGESKSWVLGNDLDFDWNKVA